MTKRQPPDPNNRRGSSRRRITATALIAAALVGAGGPAFAFWQTSASVQTSNIYLATVGFGIKTTRNSTPIASDNGAPVVLDLSDEFIGTAFDNAKPGLTPLSSFRITGWADGNYGLDYRVDVETTGSVVAVISRPLMNGECTPAASDVYWWNSEGQGEFIQNINDKPFELQSTLRKPGDYRYPSTDLWCITFPVYRGYYATDAQVRGHYLDGGVSQTVTATANWSGRTVRTKETVAGSHLLITATPTLKGTK